MDLKPRTARFGVPSRNQEYFSNVVAEILDLPYGNKRGLATKIVRAMQAAMVKALREDGELLIKGLGRWQMKTRAKRRTHVYYGNGGNLKFKVPGTVVLKPVPAKRYVHFKAEKSLRRPHANQ